LGGPGKKSTVSKGLLEWVRPMSMRFSHSFCQLIQSIDLLSNKGPKAEMPLTSQLLMLDLNQTDGRERPSVTVVRKI